MLSRGDGVTSDSLMIYGLEWEKSQLLWLEMGLFSKKEHYTIKKNIHNSAKTYGILLK